MAINPILQRDALNVQTRLRKFTVDASECWGSKWFDDDKFLTSEVDQTDDSLTFQDLVTLKAPDHWYKLDEAATGAVTDSGAYAQNGTSETGTGVAQTTLLDGGTGYSARFGNGSTAHYTTVNNFKIYANTYGGVDYTDGYINEFTLEFLLTLDGELTGTVCCPIMGQYDIAKKMFGPVTLNRVGTKNYLAFGYNFADSLSLVNDAAPYPWVYTTVTVGEVYHFMITFKNGTATLYKNGVAVMTRALGPVAFHDGGFPWVNDTKAFRIGYSSAFASTTACPAYFHLDEIVFYRTALSAFEAYRHYFKSQNFYEAEGGGSGPPPIEGNCDNRVLPTLTGETDVTRFILADSLQLGRGDQNLVDTLTFSCAEEWGQVFLQSVFRANDYLIVEKRYSSLDGTLDTGWISQGHFLVEGPVGQEIAEGRKVYTVTAKSVSKWLMLDAPYRIELVPDRTFISRREMDDVSSGVEYKSFRIPKSGTEGLFYGNIATFPTPKIWLKDFPPIIGDIVTADDIIRAKGSEESTQFVYGTGTYRIDSDYYAAAVKDKGLGAPGTIEIEAYRHLGYDDIIRDVELVGVASETIGLDVIRASLRVANTESRFVSGETYIGRTVFLQDGAAKGYMYRIVEYGPYADWFRWDGVVYTDFSVSGNFETPPPSYESGAHLRLSLTGTAQASFVEVDIQTSIGLQDWTAYESVTFNVYLGRARINTATGVIDIVRSSGLLSKAATVTEHVSNGKYWYTVTVNFTGGEQASLIDVESIKFAWTFASGDMASVDDYCIISPAYLYDGSDDLGLGLVNYVGGELPDLADDGVVIGDYITIGDANTPAQMLTKCFLSAGFQNQDPTKPFYFEFVDPTFDGGVSLPPQVFTADDGNPWGSIVKEILDQCPPNYVLYLDRDGIHRTKNVTQKSIVNADYNIVKTMDYNIDGTDYGVITRVIARGKAADFVDIGLSDTVGGGAAYGAYKLNNFSAWGATTGINKTQDDADTIINQISNGDPKTPAGWGSDAGAQTYGVIWRMYGNGTYRWFMEDSDLFWIDLGRNSTSGQLYTVEEFEVQVFSPMFPVGTIIEQTLQFYYMTEDDYVAATGHVPPAVNDDKTRENLNTLAASPFWRPLTSELTTGNGVTVIPASEFEFGVPIQLRFIKVVCGQPWHHPAESGTIYKVPYNIIAISGLRIYATTDIVQVAELGRTPPFDTEEMRNLAKRLRRRTTILDENPYLDTAEAVQAFALQELRERYTDFEPIAVSAIAPTVEVWDTVTWTNPETGTTRAYLVTGMNIGQSESTYLQLVDYTYFQEA
jgi:hypothetical protein